MLIQKINNHSVQYYLTNVLNNNNIILYMNKTKRHGSHSQLTQLRKKHLPKKLVQKEY